VSYPSNAKQVKQNNPTHPEKLFFKKIPPPPHASSVIDGVIGKKKQLLKVYEN